MKKINGAAHLKEMILSKGEWKNRLEGSIEIIEAKNYLGFASARSDSNFFVLVTFADGEEIALFGCQIRAITKFAESPNVDQA